MISGHPETSGINIGVKNNPAILISGHDLKDKVDQIHIFEARSERMTGVFGLKRKGVRHQDYEDLMIRVRGRIRKGQWFWDMNSAENSVGFHNPVKALETFARNQRYSNEAIRLVVAATTQPRHRSGSRR